METIPSHRLCFFFCMMCLFVQIPILHLKSFHVTKCFECWSRILYTKNMMSQQYRSLWLVYLVGGLVAINFIFPLILGISNHPNWRTHIFQRGGLTTNQLWQCFIMSPFIVSSPDVFDSIMSPSPVYLESLSIAQGLKRLMSRITELHQEIKEVLALKSGRHGTLENHTRNAGKSRFFVALYQSLPYFTAFLEWFLVNEVNVFQT